MIDIFAEFQPCAEIGGNSKLASDFGVATGSFERSGLGPNTQIGDHLGVNNIRANCVHGTYVGGHCWRWPHELFSVPIDNAAVYS